MTPIRDPLDELLSQWRLPDVPAPAFQREVWLRIAANEPGPDLVEKFFGFLFRPRGWAMAGALAVVLGAGAAWLETRPSGLSPHDAYVRSISPFASLHLAAK